MNKWFRDMAERVIATYLEVFIGLLIVADKLDIDAAKVAAVAALPAGLAVVKAMIASRVGREGTASLDPKEPIL